VAGVIAQVERRIEPMTEESKMRKLFAVLALLASGLAACGGSGGNKGGSGGGGSTQTAPTITSASSATWTEGTASSFTVTATGNPAPTFTESGTLPAGVTFVAPNLSGTATASGTFPITFTASNGVSPNASQSFTLTVNATSTAGTLIQLSTINEMAGNPYDLINITGSNFSSATAALAVVFSPENGDPIQMVTPILSTATTASAMIPAFYNSANVASAEIVDVRLFGTDGTTAYVSNMIPAVSVSALHPVYAQSGLVTAALLTASQNINLSVENAASGNPAYSGFVAPLGQMNLDLSPLIRALINSNGGSISVAAMNGGTVTMSAQQIAQSDQIAQQLIASFVAQAGVPILPTVQGCPAPTGDTVYDSNLCSVQQYFQSLLLESTPEMKRFRQIHGTKLRAELTKFQAAAASFGLNLCLGAMAEIVEPVGGGLAYEIVIAPMVTTAISSMVVSQELPSNTDVGLGVGLAMLDKAAFGGAPVSATTYDEYQVLKAYWNQNQPPSTDGRISNGMIGLYNNNQQSTFASWKTPGQPIETETITDPTFTTNNVSGQDSTLLVVVNPPPPPPPATYTLTVSAGTGGTVSVNTAGPYAAGTVVVVAATPDSGYTFASWSGACAGQGSACTLTMNSNLSTSASFIQSVSPPPPPPGSVTYSGMENGTMIVPNDAENDGIYCYYTNTLTISWTQSGNTISGTWSFTDSVYTLGGSGIGYGGMCPLQINTSDTFTGTISAAGISITGSQGETFSGSFIVDDAGLQGTGSVPFVDPYGMSYTDSFILESSALGNLRLHKLP
jgi:hypothetical protein